MRKLCDRAYAFDGVHYQLRAYQDPSGRQSPTFIAEPKSGHEAAYREKRAELAEHLSERLGAKRDEVRWLEQSPDGSIREYDFKNRIAINNQQITNDEQRLKESIEAQKQNYFTPDKVNDFYNERLDQEEIQDLEEQTGETLEPYEIRQDQEYSQELEQEM